MIGLAGLEAILARSAIILQHRAMTREEVAYLRAVLDVEAATVARIDAGFDMTIARLRAAREAGET